MHVDQNPPEASKNPAVGESANLSDASAPNVTPSKSAWRPTAIECLVGVSIGALLIGIALPAVDPKGWSFSPPREREITESMRQRELNSWADSWQEVLLNVASAKQEDNATAALDLQVRLERLRQPVETEFSSLRAIESSDTKLSFEVLDVKGDVAGIVTTRRADLHTSFRSR